MMPPTDRTEARSGLDLIARDARDDEELAEDLAIAEWALDEYGKKGADGTVSYDEYRNNRPPPRPEHDIGLDAHAGRDLSARTGRREGLIAGATLETDGSEHDVRH